MSLLGSLLGQSPQPGQISQALQNQQFNQANALAMSMQNAKLQAAANAYGQMANSQGLAGYGQQAEPSPSIKDPGFELSLTACAMLWETRFGDQWVHYNSVPDDYKVPYKRMAERGWFERVQASEGAFMRLIPEELRK